MYDSFSTSYALSIALVLFYFHNSSVLSLTQSLLGKKSPRWACKIWLLYFTVKLFNEQMLKFLFWMILLFYFSVSLKMKQIQLNKRLVHELPMSVKLTNLYWLASLWFKINGMLIIKLCTWLNFELRTMFRSTKITGLNYFNFRFVLQN